MLTVENLSASYGRAQALFDVGFTLEDDSLAALLGRNGSGKTTTARALMGVTVRARGSVVLDGREMLRLPTHQRARAGMQLVPEDRRVYTQFTVRENIELAYAAVRDGQGLTVSEVVDLLPKLQPLLDRMGNELSGGEQQMVAIARALVARPTTLIMDEPSQGLAPVVLEHIGDAIRLLRSEFKTSVLLTEQNVHFALGLADRVLVLDRGALVFAGTKEEFQQDTEIQSRYLSV